MSDGGGRGARGRHRAKGKAGCIPPLVHPARHEGSYRNCAVAVAKEKRYGNISCHRKAADAVEETEEHLATPVLSPWLSERDARGAGIKQHLPFN